MVRRDLETPHVLLQLRAAWTHGGGTWAIPGGALDSHEEPIAAAVREAWEEVGIDVEWSGAGVDELGTDAKSGNVIVRIDPRYFRPTEVETLLGDASKAHREMGWKPKVTFEELVAEMAAADLEAAQKDKLVMESGYNVPARHE